MNDETQELKFTLNDYAGEFTSMIAENYAIEFTDDTEDQTYDFLLQAEKTCC